MGDGNINKADKKIDWQEVRQRLEKNFSALDRSLTRSAEEEKRLLHERAVKLAQVQSSSTEEGEQLEVLEFTLADESYAVETKYVSEVVPLKEMTPLPCVPSFVLGIINLRGQILSVVDLKEFFSLPARGLTNLNKVIVLKSVDMEFGLLADVVVGVRALATAELEQAIPTLVGIGAEYVKGVTQDREVVLAADLILADPRMKIYEEVD